MWQVVLQSSGLGEMKGLFRERQDEINRNFIFHFYFFVLLNRWEKYRLIVICDLVLLWTLLYIMEELSSHLIYFSFLVV